MGKDTKDKGDNLPQSPAREKAKRLKDLRIMAGLTRPAISNDKINIYTYKSWEQAAYNGLTKKGAMDVIERVAKEGVICSLEWLYSGIGNEPQKVLNLPNKNDIKLDFLAEDLPTLKKHYSSKLVEFAVKDDELIPYFHKGDYLVGIKTPIEKIDLINNHCCLTLLTNGDLLLKKIKILSERDLIVLSGITQTQSQSDQFVDKSEIIYIAPIIWHRKQYNAD